MMFQITDHIVLGDTGSIILPVIVFFVIQNSGSTLVVRRGVNISLPYLLNAYFKCFFSTDKNQKLHVARPQVQR